MLNIFIEVYHYDIKISTTRSSSHFVLAEDKLKLLVYSDVSNIIWKTKNPWQIVLKNANHPLIWKKMKTNSI